MDGWFLLGWIVGIVVNAMIAGEKNRSVGGVIVASIFLSPVVSYLYLLAVPVKVADTKEATNKENKN